MKKALILSILTYLVLVALYIANIVQLVLSSKVVFTLTIIVVLKIIGIFIPPIGMVFGVLGFFGI